MGFPVDLVVLGVDAGLTLLFYKLYRNYSSTADLVQNAPNVELTPDLVKILEDIPERNIAYASIQGVVTPVNKVLRSYYTDEEGVAHNILFKEHKSKRTQGFWHDFINTIRDNTNWVPFTLVNPNKHAANIHVQEPSTAEYLDFTTTYDKFEPTQAGVLERGLDRLFGDVSKGFQETESMVRVGATLLGIGKIALEDGKIHLKPAEGKPYVLTELSKDAVVNKLKSNSTVFKVFSIILGLSGVIVLGIVIRHRVRNFLSALDFRRQMDSVRQAVRHRRNNNQNQSQRQEDEENAEENNAENAEQNCVICLSEPREVVLLDCGHICLCADCVGQLPSPRKCPVCRQNVVRVVSTYLP